MTYPISGEQSSNEAPGTPLTLLTLPLEIRDQIYGLLFPFGHLTILRVSKAVHAQAVPFLFKWGILRINIGYVGLGQPANVPPAMLEQIQHVRIKSLIEMGAADRLKNWYCHTLDHLLASKVARKDCHVIIYKGNAKFSSYGNNYEIDWHDPGPGIKKTIDIIADETWDIISELVCFEMVTVQLDGSFKRGHDGGSDGIENMANFFMSLTGDKVADSLGIAIQRGTGVSIVLEFHPQRYSRECAQIFDILYRD